MRLSGLISLGLISLITTTGLQAAQPGLYLGGQLGWGQVHDVGISNGDMGIMVSNAFNYSNFSLHSFNGLNTGSGFAWRAFGGYQIGFNWAMEIGWAQFNNVAVDAYTTGFDNATNQPFTVGTSSGIFKTTVFDAVGKYMYYFPCFPQASVFGKLGVAFLTGRTDPVMSVSENGSTYLGEDLIIANRFFPTASIGLGYDFRKDISADFSYTRIQKLGYSEHLGSIDEVFLGFALHFG